MADCPNIDIREHLPELMHGRLPAGLRAEVEAHVAACAECRAELALLERVRKSGATVRIDAARIVAGLPAYRAPSAFQRATRSPLVRLAAAIVLLLGGATLITDGPVKTGDTVAVVMSNPVAETAAAPALIGASTQVATRRAPAQGSELAVGELFDDLTDSELRALLQSLESLEATTSVETEVVVPSVGRGGA